MPENSAAVLMQVSWGLIPEQVEGTREWSITREEFESNKIYGTAIGEAYVEIDKRMDPSKNNWVRLDWIYL